MMHKDKVIDIEGIGPVRLIKSSRNRSIRIRVEAEGIRVSLPLWTPYGIAVAFVKGQQAWIDSNRVRTPQIQLLESTKVGKLHTLSFQHIPETQSLRTKVTPTKLIVQHYGHESVLDDAVQTRAKRAALRALQKEASSVLPPRLEELAKQSGHYYGKVQVRQLKSRWGSCDSHGNIVLNIFLMQLSWQQIDYVLCHELAHTVHMNHGSDFWREVERMMPDARMIAKRVRHTQPSLQPLQRATAFDDDMAY